MNFHTKKSHHLDYLTTKNNKCSQTLVARKNPIVPFISISAFSKPIIVFSNSTWHNSFPVHSILRIHGRIWGAGVSSTHFYFCSKDLFLLYFYVLNLLDILNIGIKCSFILTITITTCICNEEIQLCNCAKRIHPVSK